MATPVPAQPRRLNAEELAAMRKFQPMSSFDSAAEMRDFGVESLDGPVVRALIPLKSEGKLVGAAEFVLDGQKVAAALAGLDRDLWRSSLMVFIAAGVIITLSLGWAYSRLNRTNLLLSHRTQSLLRANHELMLAAKTSAIGAITAHLIHDLKNPLFGLQSFVRTRGSVDDQDWDIAADAAERMQKMIAEVVRILQEEKTTELYDLSIAEVFTVIQNKLKPEADKAGVELLITESFEETMLNRNANIVSLVLTNLAHNAIQATPRGGRVTLSAARTSEGATFEVADTGPGFSESMMKSLFTPCRSTKSGGTGLGLAISKHLANHLGAELRLKKTSSQGSTFELSVPESTFVSAPALS
jgi:signal transduction histidine kinase